MANPNEFNHEAYGILLQISDANGPGKPIDGLQASLKLSLAGNQNLAGADLSGANLAGVVLHGVDLSNARLSHANFSHARISKTDLVNADLTGANLSDANLAETAFTHANISGANFTATYLAYADFSDALLAGANFHNANFTCSNLVNVDLRGVNLRGARNFDKARIRKVTIDETQLGHVAFLLFREFHHPERNSYSELKKILRSSFFKIIEIDDSRKQGVIASIESANGVSIEEQRIMTHMALKRMAAGKEISIGTLARQARVARHIACRVPSHA